MIRGEIYWANLPLPRGSEPGKRRPVVIIQSDAFNQSGISTVVCAMITSNTALAALPGNVLLEKAVSGLGKTSVVNLSQITALDKSDLTEYVSHIQTSRRLLLERRGRRSRRKHPPVRFFLPFGENFAIL